MRISDWSSDVCSSDLARRKALPKTVDRVTFNAITKQAVTEAMKAPRALDTDLIDAYRARRALDYLVGFTLSPVLWRKLPGAKSAGRGQTVAPPERKNTSLNSSLQSAPRMTAYGCKKKN